MLTTTELQNLAGVREATLVSMYLPTHRKGAEVDQDRIRLKNHLAAADRELKGRGVGDGLNGSLESVRDALGNPRFWRHQSDGLGVLVGPDEVRMLHLDTPVQDLVYIGDRFCVRPLVSDVADEQRFFILTLSQKKIRLIACTQNSARELTEHDIPRSLRDAMGYDYEQQALQFHTEAQQTGPANMRAAMFHGQGRGIDDQKAEVEQLYHRVDAALNGLLNDRSAPIVLASVDSEVVMYRSLSKYPNLLDEHLSGNPDHLSADELHASALPLVRERLDAAVKAHAERVAAVAHTSSVAKGIDAVLPAAASARVGSVLVAPGEPIWGRFEESSGRIERHQKPEAGDEDLLDLAISRALATGAEVIAASPEQIPGDPTIAAALRF